MFVYRSTCDIFFVSFFSEVLLGNANLSLTDKEGNTALHLPCSKVSDHKGVFCGFLWFQKGGRSL